MKKKIVIINRTQFGYNTDTYEISKLIASKFDVNYICFDAGRPKRDNPNVNVVYVPYTGNFFKRAIRFLIESIKLTSKNIDFVFIVYFPGCSIINLNRNKNNVLDFRTGSVSRSRFKRVFLNSVATCESIFFKHISVISEGLAKKLRLKQDKVFITPLGSHSISNLSKEFNVPKLFYIGTFENRNISETIEGVYEFIKRNPRFSSSLTYDIVGFGSKSTVSQLNEKINTLGLKNNIVLRGRLNHSEALQYFDQCNIGVSYVPITDYYEHQPPTKTHEYINSGMVCIATDTSENRKIITEANGITCKDNPESFCDSLSRLVHNFSFYSSDEIRETNIDSTWTKIAESFGSNLSNLSKRY